MCFDNVGEQKLIVFCQCALLFAKSDLISVLTVCGVKVTKCSACRVICLVV